MDKGIYALMIAIGIGVLIFAITFLLFIVLRKFRSKHITLDASEYNTKNAVFSESDTPLKDLLVYVWRTNLFDVYNLCGLEAYMYLSLHRQILKAITIIAILGLTVLIPVYIEGNDDVSDDLEKTGIGHILYSEQLMIVPVVFFILYSLIGYWLVYSVLRSIDIDKVRSSVSTYTPYHSYAVEIKGIPTDLKPSEVEQEIRSVFFEFKEDIAIVYSVPNFTESYKASLRIKKLNRKLKIYQEKAKKTKRVPKIRIKYCTKKVDALQYYSQEIDRYTHEYNEFLEKGKTENTGFVFIICHYPSSVEKICSNIPREYNKLNSIIWSAKKASSPSEIKWENMGTNYLIQRSKRACLMFFFVFIFFVILTPALFSKLIYSILDELGTEDILDQFFSQFFPSLILLLYQSVILKLTIDYMVSFESHTNESSETLSKLIKFLIFMSFYMFIVPILGIQVTAMIKQTLDGNLSKWRDDLAKGIIFSGQLYCIFIIQRTFFSNGFDLLQIGSVLKTRFELAIADTDLEEQLAYQAGSAPIGYKTAVLLTSFLMVMSFSITFPVLPLFGVVYFVTNYWIQKYLLLCCYAANKDTTGVKLPKTCIRTLLTYIYFFQFITSTSFLLNGSPQMISIGGVLNIGSLVVFIILFLKIKSIINTTLKYIGFADSSSEPLLGVNENYYKHPIDDALCKQKVDK